MNAFPSDPISPREAARLLGVHVSQVYRWLLRGRLAYWDLPSGHKRVSRADVLALPKPGKAVAVVSLETRQAALARNVQDVETLRRYGVIQ